MLKGVHPLIGPDLLATLARMGHGDTLIVADGNFPAHTQGPPVHHLDGHDSMAAIEAILTLLPLDRSLESPLFRMHPLDPHEVTPVQAAVHRLCERVEDRPIGMEPIERFDFYRRAADSFAIVITGERQPYCCFGLVKGVIGPA
jgi:L-fucose mutarotase